MGKVELERKTLLTDEEVNHYREEGYVIPDYRLPDDVLGRLREALDRLINDNPNIRPEMLLGVHISKGYADGMKGSRDFFDLATYPSLLDIIE